MALTVTQAFEKCLEDITATKHQKETLIPAKKNSAIENLTATFPSTSDLPFSQAYLIGSAAKGTIVRLFDDVDVLAIFSNEKNAWNKYWNDSAAFPIGFAGPTTESPFSRSARAVRRYEFSSRRGGTST